MTSVGLMDGVECAAMERLQRGLGYGDGVFETMRARDGRVALWPAHMARMAESCRRLGFDAPTASLLEVERDRFLRSTGDAVLKLMVWRHAGGAGYDTGSERRSHRCWTATPLPSHDSAPLRVRWCDLQLARQPRLAGLKTLNRLEQVLARGEWSGTEWDEGLLCDSSGQVISAIAGNLFAVIDGRLATPTLGQCGVAGVLRGWMLDQAQSIAGQPAPIDVRAILRAELERASELFVTNAVRGIRGIGLLGDREYGVGPETAQWIQRARVAGLMDGKGNAS
ncbi:MAG: aminodeoxychorismate lyase [Lysobacterales bacterium]